MMSEGYIAREREKLLHGKIREITSQTESAAL